MSEKFVLSINMTGSCYKCASVEWTARGKHTIGVVWGIQPGDPWSMSCYWLASLFTVCRSGIKEKELLLFSMVKIIKFSFMPSTVTSYISAISLGRVTFI